MDKHQNNSPKDNDATHAQDFDLVTVCLENMQPFANYEDGRPKDLSSHLPVKESPKIGTALLHLYPHHLERNPRQFVLSKPQRPLTSDCNRNASLQSENLLYASREDMPMSGSTSLGHLSDTHYLTKYGLPTPPSSSSPLWTTYSSPAASYQSNVNHRYSSSTTPKYVGLNLQVPTRDSSESEPLGGCFSQTERLGRQSDSGRYIWPSEMNHQPIPSMPINIHDLICQQTRTLPVPTNITTAIGQNLTALDSLIKVNIPQQTRDHREVESSPRSPPTSLTNSTHPKRLSKQSMASSLTPVPEESVSKKSSPQLLHARKRKQIFPQGVKGLPSSPSLLKSGKEQHRPLTMDETTTSGANSNTKKRRVKKMVYHSLKTQQSKWPHYVFIDIRPLFTEFVTRQSWIKCLAHARHWPSCYPFTFELPKYVTV